jgi:cytochrome c
MIAHPASTRLVRAHLLRSVALILALGAAGGTARAADPAEGRRIAERWCSSCHVAGDRSGGTDAVPTLESIANDRRRSPDWVRQWLNDPHPPMPNLPLTRVQIEDVVAYLGSLSR